MSLAELLPLPSAPGAPQATATSLQAATLRGSYGGATNQQAAPAPNFAATASAPGDAVAGGTWALLRAPLALLAVSASTPLWRRSRRHSRRAIVALASAGHEFGDAPAKTDMVGNGGDFPAPEPGLASNGKTAIVVGAGVGGLAMAGRLARAGFKVTLLEKNETLGGRMRSEVFAAADGMTGHRFDTGPSLLLFPEKYRDAFAALGAKLEDHVKLARVEPTAMRVHYAEDWSTLDLLYDSEAMRRQLEEVEPGAGQKYFRWLGEARASLDLGLKAFIEQDSTSALDFVDLARVGPLALAGNPILLLGPQTWQLATHFQTDKVKALFSYQHLYVGLRPDNAPGVFSLLAATELTDGIWYPVGGFATVRDGLSRLAAAHGVETKLGAEVESILVDEPAGGQRLARGVKLASGEEMLADIIIANPDLPYVYDKLLEGQYDGVGEEAKQLRNDLEYSCGMIEFCWALKSPLKELTQHNVFLGNDYTGSWDRPCTVEDFRTRHSINFYVHRPTYTDGTAAPAGEDNVMVELPIGNAMERAAARKKAGLTGEEDEAALVDAARDLVISQFERMGYGSPDKQGMKALIKGERVVTPSEWERRYNLTHGAVFGLSHGLLQLACFRPPRQTGIGALDAKKVKGLHFVGASTRPGNGVPLVMMGVEVAFENIVAEQGVSALPPLPLEPMGLAGSGGGAIAQHQEPVVSQKAAADAEKPLVTS